MQFRAALLAASVLAAPLVLAGQAHAQPVAGPYISLGGGLAQQQTITAKNLYANGTAVPGAGKAVFKNGYDLEASAGYGFNNGWRIELEGDYSHNSASKVKYNGADYGAHGSARNYGAFINGLYDFDVGLPWLYPYAGAGLGWQEASFHNYSSSIGSVDKSRGSFAYQGIVGLSFPIAPVMGLSATIDYRFVGLATARKYSATIGGVPGTFKAQGQYSNQFNIGLRYEFSPPAPPAPAPVAAAPQAAPAAPVAKTYLVFFDWDKYNLTPRATQIIAQAAADSKTQSVTTLEVNGYTDTSGTAAYNQGLSVKRAKAVAAQLVADGVPASEIQIQGYGDTHLLVPTGAGVREPQNRRVEILFH